jgi:chorismate mutase/prephenate dehydratase
MAKKKPSSETVPVENGRKPTLAALRRRIDQLDREIVERLSARAAVAQQIGALKDASGTEIYAPRREEEVFERVREANRGPLSDETLRHIFRELISGCRSLERQLRVAYLGPEHSYSHLAAIHRFGQSVALAPVGSIAAVFEEVERGQADFGLVPIENSTDGRITDTLDMFAKTPVRICGEVPLRIHHCLLALCPRGEVRNVYSKPQALSQCRNWLSKHLPGAEIHPVASTSEAARIAGEEKGAAAVASLQAGVSRGLDVLAKNIEDDPQNLTRFAVIGQKAAERTGNDKTSLMFEVEHRPGTLADAMAIFKRKNLNMTWIESFPIPSSPGRYLFFVELLGHQSDVRLRRALAMLEKKAIRLEVLGSYARMDPIE